jgi:hypothetical protein
MLHAWSSLLPGLKNEFIPFSVISKNCFGGAYGTVIFGTVQLIELMLNSIIKIKYIDIRIQYIAKNSEYQHRCILGLYALTLYSRLQQHTKYSRLAGGEGRSFPAQLFSA